MTFTTSLILLAFLSNLSSIKAQIIALESDHFSGSDPSPLQKKNIPISQKNWTFQDFKMHFTKAYSSKAKQTESASSFRENIEKLKKTNCTPCGVTSLMDKSQQQINGLKGLLPGKGDSSKNQIKQSKKRLLQTLDTTIRITAPLNFDWRKYNVVTIIKDQKDCGTCWAFTATAFFESELIRRNQTNFMVDLAEQFLYQCDNASYGCQGGYVQTAMEVALATGLPRQFFNIYNPQQNYSGICVKDSNLKLNGASNVVGYFSKIERLSDQQIIQLLLQRPLMIGVNADEWPFYLPYQTDRTMKCTLPRTGSFGTVINHAVLLIGYTETEWIIKNSWGTAWGMKGIIYISRNPANNCGVGHYVFTLDYPLPIPKL